ncbi:membrane protein insertion efficiency factor YidD [Candidatus Roizmanbacteria bacterium]|nr:membrane protein insertion efficiency factor YidD [Candidatus Roizmanbacteria bacterium]
MVKKIVLTLIKWYQKTKFFHGYIFRTLFMTDKVCRFTPTCSEYTYQAVEKYGSMKGLFLGFKRIIHCHPWSKKLSDPLK